MKKIIYIFALLLIAIACKDPNIGPGDDKNPVDNAGLIRFDNPAIGQISYYVQTTANGYYEQTPSAIKYSTDSIRWEITKELDKNKFQITETFIGEIFTDGTGSNARNTLILEKLNTGVLIYLQNNLYSPLLGYTDSVRFEFGNTDIFQFNFWRIETDENSLISSGVVENYVINGKNYERLDVYSNLEPMTYDGPGNVYTYNEKYGLTRQYSINPWVGDIKGFDLVAQRKIDNSDNKKLIKKWRLAYVHYKDGSKKSISDIVNQNTNTNQRPNFILNIIDENYLEGQSGCNHYTANYKRNGPELTISNFTTTEVYCFFTDIYSSMLMNTKSYDLEENRLILYSENNDYVALEFVEDLDNHFGFNLESTNWSLRNVHYNDNSVVPISKITGTNSNNGKSNFTLYFKKMGELDGFSGCNKFGGTYKIDNEIIEIKAASITEVYCKFSDDYGKILSNSTIFKADEYHLIIYSNYDKYSALEFDRIR